ncbi:MAG: glutamate--tRNA ligase [Alphaproteobacteria bacterium RIFOXYD12_FULL_60_8]|nr:MAG: glutamate--tRNA ligase [Alphaproteobacteria bacterium RIFOXYD12_FULL_60_8]
MTAPVVRFAPSPTGLLHVGNARVALINWLLARAGGGRFILRIDDTDAERSEARFVDAIEQDLTWLGLTWDGDRVHQSARTARYDAAVEKLKVLGRVYPCFETPEELDLKRKVQRSRGLPPVYDRSALKLTETERAALIAGGRTPHWRFKLDHADVTWNDLGKGPTTANGAHVSDPILVRADGAYLYTLPSVVDDIELGITHIVRGEDHVTNTGAQIQIFRALEAEPPLFAHLPLMVGADGEGLSKRLGSLSLSDLRAEGIEPLALAALLARLGSSEAVEPAASLDELVASFDLARYGRASPRFDPRELSQLNARVVHGLSHDEAAARLPDMTLEPALWEAVRANLEHLSDVRRWWTVCHGEIAPAIEAEDHDFCAQAANLLPPEPWGPETWGIFVEAVKTASGRKGKGLFMPLRRALTGEAHGPELNALLPLIGKSKAGRRLRGVAG